MGIKGAIEPEYSAQKEGKIIFIDADGGFGMYPVQNKESDITSDSLNKLEINYDFQSGEDAWFSVFPPRPYDWEKVKQPLAHTGSEKEPYPSLDLIKEAAKHAKIFAVHSYFWPGGVKDPWLIADFTPTDMGEFLRVRDQVHENGMKFVVYASPYYSTAPDFWSQMEKLINEYKVDGLYFDGISFDFRKSYEMVKKARQMLGNDKILYIHSSIDPFNSNQIYAPFIDAYADYILRGESGRPANLNLNDFLRYTISGYNISGASGYWLHYGSAEISQQGYAFNLPDSKDIEIALASHVYLPWSDGMYQFSEKKDWQGFIGEYFRKLEDYQNKNIPLK